jgi:hypothetical protein
MSVVGVKKTAFTTRLRLLRDNSLIAETPKGGYAVVDVLAGVVESSQPNTELTPATPSTAAAKSVSEVMACWRTSYLTAYGTEYTPSNWARETTQLKTLMRRYDEVTLQAIIEVVFRLYAQRWQSKQFPRPTIGALVSWLAVQAEPFAAANLASLASLAGATEIANVGGDSIAEMFDKGWI